MARSSTIGPEAVTDLHRPAVIIGRYLLHRQIARGGMATIHIARLIGDEGFSRIVAAKRLLPEFAEDAEFVTMFLDEARIASKVHHRNVVPVLDVVNTGADVILVQEYVHGVPLHWLLRAARQGKERVPIEVAVSVACQVLAGLQAAHDTTDEMGVPLSIVHRDVSPQNVMIATDGTARLLDFGVAKATLSAHVTREATFKGKLAYSAPEHILGQATSQSDLYSLAIVLWEQLVGHRMHQSPRADVELVNEIMQGRLPSLTGELAGEREVIGAHEWLQLEALEAIITRALAVEPSRRFATASEMELALAQAVRPASAAEVARWLKSLGQEFITGREQILAAEEKSWRRASVTIPRVNSAESGSFGPRSMVGAVTADDAPASIATRAKRRRNWLALAGLLAASALAGILVAVIGSDDVAPVAPPASAPAPTPAAAVQEPTLEPTPEPMVQQPAARVEPTPTPAPEPAPAPAAPAAAAATEDDVAVETSATTAAPSPAAPSPSSRTRRPSRSSSKRAAADSRADAATDAKPAAPAAAPAAKADCSPPYYFVGEKKVFKAQCL
jgi:serine/threonine protein kinase